FRPGGLQRGWEKVGHVLLRRPGLVWVAAVAVMAPFVVFAGLHYDRLSYDLIGDLPADAPSVAGTRALQEHFPAGTIGPVTVLVVDPQVDFAKPQGEDLVKQLTHRLCKQRKELGLTDVRSLTSPLGITAASAVPLLRINVSADLRKEAMEKAAREF